MVGRHGTLQNYTSAITSLFKLQKKLSDTSYDASIINLASLRSHSCLSFRLRAEATGYVPKSRSAPSSATSRTFYSRSVEFFVTATLRSIFAQPGLGTTSLDLPRPYANAATYATAGSRVLARTMLETLETWSLAYVAHDLFRCDCLFCIR